MKRNLIAEINLDAISHNFKIAKKKCNNKSIIAIMKADGYGHGAIEISKRLEKEKVSCLAVAFSKEAVQLRESGIKTPILVLFDYNINDIFTYKLIPVVSDKKTAILISKTAERKKMRVPIHIKVDTGMGRIGIVKDPVKEIMEISNLKGVIIDGIMSHFSASDKSDTSFSKMQISKFSQIKNNLIEKGLNIKLFHISNSAAILNIREANFSAVRPGLMLYGYCPVYNKKLTNNLIPVMSLKTNILSIRKVPQRTPISYGKTFITKSPSLIGILPIGYADGFNRKFSNNAEVIIKNKKAPVIGTVCMDLTMIDLSNIKNVSENDEVIILGSQGKTSITATELAERIDTIPYEILTSLGNNAKRIYF